MTEHLDAVVVGATGYVAGELLRLVAGHPRLKLAAGVSRSAEDPIAAVFPHLAPVMGSARFVRPEEVGPADGVFCCATHGASSGALAEALDRV